MKGACLQWLTSELDRLVKKDGSQLARPLQRRLRDLMWERCGVVRDDSELRTGLEELAIMREASADVDVRPSAEGWGDLTHLLDLRAGLLAAEATLRGSAEAARSGSRAGPFPTSPNSSSGGRSGSWCFSRPGLGLPILSRAGLSRVRERHILASPASRNLHLLTQGRRVRPGTPCRATVARLMRT